MAAAVAAAAVSSSGAQMPADGAVFKTEPEADEATGGPDPGAVLKRDPAVPLICPLSGARPLTWAQDHRLAVCTTGAVAVVELLCDVRSGRQDMTVHRTSIPVRQDVLQLKVGPAEQLARARHKFSSHPDPTVNQAFMTDRVINPHVGVHRGVKCTSWSPLGCDGAGRCLLAVLSLDQRLTVHHSAGRLAWSPLADLTQAYSLLLVQSNYGRKKKDGGGGGGGGGGGNDSSAPAAGAEEEEEKEEKEEEEEGEGLLNLEELRRRFRMQTPLRMAWSSVYTVRQRRPTTAAAAADDHARHEERMVLLAVLMENGDVVLWQFDLPFVAGAPPTLYDVIESGVAAPADVAWWEHAAGERRMSGLIVGGEAGPVRILPVGMARVPGYVTLRKPVVLWQEEDRVPAENVRCVALRRPALGGGGGGGGGEPASLVLASRGCYVFWCLLTVSPAGLGVRSAHVPGLHSLPIVSLAATRGGGDGEGGGGGGGVAIYTCSMDGSVKKLVPRFSAAGDLTFGCEDVLPPDALPGGRRALAVAVSPNGAYLAVANAQGMVGGYHPAERTYQVNFFSLRTAEAAAATLLRLQQPAPGGGPAPSLYRTADLLDLLRWRVLRDKAAPPALMDAIDEKIAGGGGGGGGGGGADSPVYFWRLKLFLLRTLLLSLQKEAVDPRWKPSHKHPKAFIRDEEEEEEEEVVEGDEEEEEAAEEEVAAEGGRARSRARPAVKVVEEEAAAGRRAAELRAEVRVVEAHLTREHMKKVLGEVYLNICSAVNTSIPTCGLVDYLSEEPGDRAAEVLIGHIQKKMQKQKFPERCSLCREELPFSHFRETACKNGHLWQRCVLSYQSCQALTFKRCLLLDSIAAEPEDDAPNWIRKILQGPCPYCDSPMI